MNDAKRFSFRLALALGHPNPPQMLRDMPHHVFCDWLEYASVEPFGHVREDMQAAIICATIANAMARGKGQRAFMPKDFMLNFEPVVKREPEDIIDKVMLINKLFGGSVVKGPPPKVD